MSSRMDRMEAGMENYDTAMVAVGVGGAVAGAALTKIAPKGAKRTMKRVKSYTRKRVEKFEEKYPCPFKTILFSIAAVNLALYYSDVYSDGDVTATFYEYEHYGWFAISAGLMGGQYFVAMGGIAYYVRKENPFGIDWDPGYDTGKKILFFVTIPFWLVLGPLFLDILMPFYRLLQNCLPDKLVTFMVQYEATRTLSENMLESIPQMGFQAHIYFFCKENEAECGGISQEAGTVLVRSMIISGIAILFHLVQVVYEMKKEGLGFCGYMKSLMTMGAGLPLKAITSDRIGDRLDYSDQELLPAQVRSLAAVIGNNKSLRTVELPSCNIDDEGARHLATMLEKNTSLKTLYLENNKITDDGLKHLAIPLEKNTSLKTLWLNGNNITDDNLKMKLKDIWNKTKGREGGLYF